MEYRSISIADAVREINRSYYLPAIQREFVWGTDRIEKFSTPLCPTSRSFFLFWRSTGIADSVAVYEFVRDYDRESPHTMRQTSRNRP